MFLSKSTRGYCRVSCLETTALWLLVSSMAHSPIPYLWPWKNSVDIWGFKMDLRLDGKVRGIQEQGASLCVIWAPGVRSALMVVMNLAHSFSSTLSPSTAGSLINKGIRPSSLHTRRPATKFSLISFHLHSAHQKSIGTSVIAQLLRNC